MSIATEYAKKGGETVMLTCGSEDQPVAHVLVRPGGPVLVVPAWLQLSPQRAIAFAKDILRVFEEEYQGPKIWGDCAACKKPIENGACIDPRSSPPRLMHFDCNNPMMESKP